MSNLTVYFTKGLPASGKSTYSKNLLKTIDAVRINKDSIRNLFKSKETTVEKVFDYKKLFEMFYMGELKKPDPNNFTIMAWSILIKHFKNKSEEFLLAVKNGGFKGLESYVIEIEKLLLEFAVKEKRNIILDNTNYNRSHYVRAQEICKNYNFKIIDMHNDFGVTLQDCIERNKNREDSVPENVITEMAEKYNVFNNSKTENKAYISESKYIIVDIDGTLANNKHRVHHVRRFDNNKADWDNFFSEIDKDTLIQSTKDLIDKDYATFPVVIVTGRPEKYREITKNWLKKYNVRHDILLMRRDSDKRPDNVVKQEILDLYLDKNKVEVCIDDRPIIIRQWKKNGLNIIDVGDGLEF